MQSHSTSAHLMPLRKAVRLLDTEEGWLEIVEDCQARLHALKYETNPHVDRHRSIDAVERRIHMLQQATKISAEAAETQRIAAGGLPSTWPGAAA